MGFLDDIFDIGVIDFNGDGNKDFGERLISYKIMEECLKEEYGDEESDDDDLDYYWDNDDSDPDLDDYDTEDEELSDESDSNWDDYDLDGDLDDYDLDENLDDYDTEDEELSEESDYDWDNDDLDPDWDDYGIEDEELNEESNSDWDDHDPDENLDDYNTEDEELSDESDYDWDDYDHDGDLDDYDTEDEEASEDSDSDWDSCDLDEELDDYDLDENLDDYDTEDEEASEDSDSDWDSCDLDEELDDYDPDENLDDYDTEDEELSDESDYDWDDYDLEDAIILKAENPVQKARPVCICPSIDEDDEVKRFINQHPKTLIAAKYLTSDGDFLYAQAIKDNFELPCSLPDESYEREMEFKEIIWKIAVRDVKLSFDVWAWCMEKFLPYREYDSMCCKNLLENVLYNFYRFPDDYLKQFVHYLSENEKFCSLVMTSCEGYVRDMNNVICEAISEKLFDLADALFKNELEKSKHDWKSTCNIIDDMVLNCRFYDDLEPMEYFRDKYIPLIKEIPEGLVHDKIWEVQPEIQKFIDNVETKNPKYAYTRRNAWRKNVSDEERALENPLYYNSEEEYKQAVHEAKYRWRITTIYSETYGLNPENFETEKEFQSALDAAREKHRKEQAEAYRLQREKALEERRMKAKEEKALAKEELEEIKADKNIYIYCSVLLPRANKPYWFRSDDESVEIGDMVLVPLGEDDREVRAKVVSVGKFLRIAAPYPVEETKLILGKI